MTFQGETYQEELDFKRLSSQLERVRNATKSGEWVTLRTLTSLVGGSEASISARLRDLRKEGKTVNRRRVGEPTRGLFEYQVLDNSL